MQQDTECSLRSRFLARVGEQVALLPRLQSGRAMAATLTAFMDDALIRLWNQTLEGVEQTGFSASLFALGGTARRELCPHSDLDLLLLYDGDTATIEPVADGLRTALLDQRFRVGLATRTLEENRDVLRSDITVATSLVDARLLVQHGAQALDAVSPPSIPLRGEGAELASDLRQDARAQIRLAGKGPFLEAILQGLQERHQRFGDTIYLLEPQLKAGRGGLRDLQTVAWTAAVLFDNDSLSDLARCPHVTRLEAQRVLESYDFVMTLRHLLHHAAGWKNDRLTFPFQEQLAQSMHFSSNHRELAVESLMRAFYQHAHTLEQRSRRWLERWSLHAGTSRNDRQIALEDTQYTPVPLEPWPLELREGRIAASDDFQSHFTKHPEVWVRIFQVASEQRLALHPELADSVAAAARSLGESWANHPAVIGATCELLTSVDVSKTLVDDFFNLGLFSLIFPEFRPVHGWVHHDIYHVYAIDVHSLFTLDCAKLLLRGELPEAQAWSLQLGRHLGEPRRLLMAALFHDVGKGRGGQHSNIGARLFRDIGTRLKLAVGLCPPWHDDDTEEVAWLVEQHLTMMNFSQRRDLTDDSTIDDFAGLVGSLERLDALTALSLVDMRSVQPGPVSTWKEALLLRLYSRTRALMESPASGLPNLAAQMRRQLARALTDPAQLELMTHLPDRLLAAQPFAVVCAILDTLANPADGTQVRLVEAGDHPRVLVIGDDAPGVLATFAAAFAALGVDIGGAHVYTTDDEVAIDVFGLSTRPLGDGSGELVVNLKRLIDQALAGAVDLDRLIAQRRGSELLQRDRPSVRTHVALSNELTSEQTLVEVAALNRLGLLATITAALRTLELDIHVSLVSTEGAKAVDVFYVTRKGKKLPTAELPSIAQTLTEHIDAKSQSGRR